MAFGMCGSGSDSVPPWPAGPNEKRLRDDADLRSGAGPVSIGPVFELSTEPEGQAARMALRRWMARAEEG